MKSRNKLFAFSALALLAMPALTGCASDKADIVIKALNCEDYIAEKTEFEFTYPVLDEEGNPTYDLLGEPITETVTYPNVLKGFEAYESMRLGKKVKVVYDCYDTNETMLSSLKTGKTSYDLICASDYTIQKMMSLDMLQKIDRDRIPNYNAYCPQYHMDMMESITASINGVPEKMADYSVGYMWGTLGILYNPEKVSRETGVSLEEVMFDMQDWSSLWASKYRNQMSVKDSMRDTYSVGIMKLFQEEIVGLMEESGCFDMEDAMLTVLPEKYDEACMDYNASLSEIFNRCDEKTVAKVQEVLLNLKENVFGFEVDSGKDDMVKGMVGMNLAWSGDAVYAMERGENEANNTIYYSIPKTGGNIWFDSWCIPKTSDAEHKAVAEDFLNFISDPTVAAANMDEIGYTPFIAGDTVHTLARLWYDPRSYAMYVYHDASNDPDCTWEDSDFIYGEPEYEVEVDEEGNPVMVEDVDEEGNPILVPVYVQEVDVEGEPLFDDDGNPIYKRVEGDPDYDEELGIMYQGGFDLENDDVAEFDFENGILNMVGSNWNHFIVDGDEEHPHPWAEYPEIYNAKAELVNELIAAYNETVPERDQIDELEEVEEWGIRDLTYMFQGTIDAGDVTSESPDENNFLFYTDEIEEIEFDGEIVEAGRLFYAQYPDNNLIPKLAVMRDYGENNIYVLKMWSEVKSNNLPLAGVVVFAIILVAAIIGIIGFVATKRHYHEFRVARRKAAAKEAERLSKGSSK